MKTYMVSHQTGTNTETTINVVNVLGGKAGEAIRHGDATIVVVNLDAKYEACIRCLPEVIGVMCVG